MDGGSQEPEDDGDAARAFEALREEVAALRRGVELIARQGRQSETAAPDYSPTLGKMEQALQAIAGRLAAVERQPALTLTPASLGREIDGVVRGVVGTVSHPLAEAMREVQTVTRDLKALAGHVHERREQRQWLATAGAVGAMGGMLLWFMLTAMLPWGGGTWLASLAFGGRWNAGEAMMQDASPAQWERMARLYKACPQDSTTDLCEAAITVRTIQPGQDEGRGTSSVTRGGRAEQQDQRF